jgi:hypothetical protein
MNAKRSGIVSHEVKDFSAAMTAAVYRVALGQGTPERWLELELALWKAVTDTVDQWLPDLPSGVRRSPPPSGRLVPPLAAKALPFTP